MHAAAWRKKHLSDQRVIAGGGGNSLHMIRCGGVTMRYGVVSGGGGGESVIFIQLLGFYTYMTMVLSPTSNLPQSLAASCCQSGATLSPAFPKRPPKEEVNEPRKKTKENHSNGGGGPSSSSTSSFPCPPPSSRVIGGGIAPLCPTCVAEEGLHRACGR